jgi:iron complex outermembrane receptor protein
MREQAHRSLVRSTAWMLAAWMSHAGAAPGGAASDTAGAGGTGTIDADIPLGTVEVTDQGWEEEGRNHYALPNATAATKTDTPLMETPGSVNVITRKQIEDRQAYAPEEALKYTSGINSPSAGGRSPYDAAFYIRGFSTKETGDIGGFYYRDGFRMSGIPISFANLERMEVLKGPASVLYGRAEPGGLLNVVYKKPQATPFYSLEQQFGSYDYYRTAADATGPVTSDNNLLYRVAIQSVDSNSFQPYIENNFVSVAPTLSWLPSDRTRVDFQFEYSHNEWTYPQGVPVINGKPANVPPSRMLELYKPKDPDGAMDNFVGAINLTHDFNDDWQLRWNGLYANQHTDWRRGGVPTVDSTTGLATEAVIYNEPDNERRWWFTTLNLTGKVSLLGVKNTLLVGFDYLNERLDGPQYYTTRPVSFNVYQPYSGPSIPRPSRAEALANPDFFQNINDWYGIYLQDQIDLTEQIHLVLGGRYDHAEACSCYSREDVENMPREEALNPRYGIVYQPVSWFSTYYQYLESIGTSNGRAQDRKPFDPETSQQHEAGLKFEAFDGALNSTLAFFHLTKQNLRTTHPLLPDFQVAVGEARSQGVEWDLVGRVVEGLNLIASYTYTDTKITENNDGNEGNRLPNVPESAGSLWATYDLTEDFKIGAGVYVAGSRQGDTANSYRMAGYARVDAMAAYKWRIDRSRLTAQVNINNLLDQDYWAYSNEGTRVFQGAPLTVLGSLRLEY